MLSPYYRNRKCIQFPGEMECESEGKISYDHAIEAAASSQNSLAGGSRGKWQTLARVNVGPEIAATLFKIQLGSTCGNAEILEDEALPKKVFLKRISSYFGTRSLSTVCTRCY